MITIEVVKGDITSIPVNAIVNAANSALAGGGGVDGAIHRAGGPDIMAECMQIGGCPTGEAVATTAGKLPANKVIHTVGPIWQGGNSNEKELLGNAYLNSLKLADELKLSTISFPNISTGVYGFPKTLAADIAVKTVKSFHPKIVNSMKVIFVCFDNENYQLYKEQLK